MPLSLRQLRAALLLGGLFLLGACQGVCEELVDRRCDCGPEACRAARDELKLATELLRTLGGTGGRQALAERCTERLRAFSCAPAGPAAVAPAP